MFSRHYSTGNWPVCHFAQAASIILAVHLAVAAVEAEDTPDRRGVEFFEAKIRPVLVRHCYKCHSSEAESIKGGLRLDTRQMVRHGGESGLAVVPGDVDSSLLLEAIRYETFEMPPDGKLSEAVIADFVTWISMGAPDPRDNDMALNEPPQIDVKQARQFWSFRPPTRQSMPTYRNESSAIRRLDHFILARLESIDLVPNSPADRRTLIRRVSFDLTGLPPSPDQVEAFVHDPTPDAYHRLVDRLLASPHYGERWARMWLDVARYAEDQAHIVGSNSELFYPNAYRYRDWVIRALNDDLPYDLFIKFQLAADLIDSEQEAEQAALGLIGLGPKYYRRRSPEVMADEWEDRVDTVARGLLGLTVACARCHDHKFDPIPTEDYYALAGVFASTEMFNRPLDGQRETDEDGQTKKPGDALHIVRDTTPTNLNVFIRGDINNQGRLVERRFLTVLSHGQPKPFRYGSGRLELADAIVDANNPLTARVLVNRIWALDFGQPLVATPSNFGHLGEPPTHPQLLDDLAVQFVQTGWSIKRLQREMVLSATYQQSSDARSKGQAIDPENRWLWRMNRRRLDVESWRDAILAAAGRLSRVIGGRSIDPQSTEETRRTVYSRISRLDLDTMLALFDFPDPNAHSARRSLTTTPLQKLFVLNSPFMMRQSDALADRLWTDASEDHRSRIRLAYWHLFGRLATDEEVALGLDFVKKDDADDKTAWSQYAQVLLASNEMLTID